MKPFFVATLEDLAQMQKMTRTNPALTVITTGPTEFKVFTESGQLKRIVKVRTP
jgi:hypothetical protein